MTEQPPPVKRCSVTLKYVPLVKTWQVMTITNSALLNPGNMVNHDYLLWFEKQPHWDFTVIAVDIDLAQLIHEVPIPLPFGL